MFLLWLHGFILSYFEFGVLRCNVVQFGKSPIFRNNQSNKLSEGGGKLLSPNCTAVKPRILHPPNVFPVCITHVGNAQCGIAALS
jgi:hypothetical protein